MKLSMPPITAFRTFLIFYSVIVTVIFYLFHLQGQSGSYISSVFAIIALLLTLIASLSVVTALGRGPQFIGFFFIFIGILSTTTGQLLWTVFTYFGRSDLANSYPPYLFFATYIINFLGYVKLGWTAKIKLFEYIGIVIGLSVLGLVLITLASATHPLTFNFSESGYLLGDALRIVVIALILQIVVIYQGGLLGRYWLSIFIANFFIIIANFTSSVFAKQYFNYLWPFSLIDLLFIGAYLYVAHGLYGIADSYRLAQKKIIEHKK